MNYKISYDCNTKNNCGYFGYEFSEAYIKQLFSKRVRNKLIDALGTNFLLDEFQDISATGFVKDILVNIFSLENNFDEFPTWRIGEAFTECFLEDEYKVRFYYNSIRDARNPNSSLTGADLVSFIDIGSDTVFLFGEVKSSSDARSPPHVLYGRSGLVNQLKNLKNDERVRNNIVRYIGFKVANLPKGDEFRIDFETALKVYLRNKKLVQLFGVLVRDTMSNEKDLKSRFQALDEELDEAMGLKLVALYVPIAMREWNGLVSIGGVENGN